MNIIFEGVVSLNGYQSSMLKLLERKLEFEKCVLISKDYDGQDDYDSKKYELINYDLCAHTQYENFYDLSSMQPLNKKILTAMEEYEPMAVKMLMRMYEISFFTYAEAKRMYLQHVKFWNHVIEENNIGYIVITGVPHHTHDYILYALANVKSIPVCLITVCQIAGRRIATNSLEKIGEKISLYYENTIKGSKNTELPEDILNFYNRKKYCNIMQEQSSMMTKEEKKVMFDNVKNIFCQDISKERMQKAIKKMVKQTSKAVIERKDIQSIKDIWNQSSKEYYYIKRGRKKMRKMAGVKYFDSIAQLPNFDDRYVVFFLHLQPEATTMPQAGVFVEQELAIEILAFSLKKSGIKLYVKEHFVQQRREREFYDELRKIDNVTLIRSDAGSKEIIMNSMAVATCTGTVTLEAIINGKPSLVFGNVGLDKGPGIYPVGSVEECNKVYQEIFTPHYKIEEQEVKNYLKAFADKSFRAYMNAKEAVDEPLSGLTIEDSREQMVKYIEEAYYEQIRMEKDEKNTKPVTIY